MLAASRIFFVHCPFLCSCDRFLILTLDLCSQNVHPVTCISQSHALHLSISRSINKPSNHLNILPDNSQLCTVVIALLRLQAPTLACLPSLVLGMIRNDSKNAPHLLSKAALLHVQAMMPASNLFGSYIGEQLPGAEAYGHPQLTPFWIPRWRDAGDGNMWQVGTTMKDHGPVQTILLFGSLFLIIGWVA